MTGTELDVRRLRVLREVAMRGTVAAAAESLGFTASAISQQLGTLEREAGSVLLERAGRRLRLTDAGQLLVDRTEPVLVALEEAKAALEQARTEVGGALRVAAFGSVSIAVVFPVVAELAERYPQLHISVFDFELDDALRELRLGELDLLIAHEYDHERRKLDADIVRVELFSEDMAIAAPAGRYTSKANGRSAVSISSMADAVWAAGAPTSDCGRAVRHACRVAGFEPDVRFNSNENSVLLSAVANAGAVTMLPRLALCEVPPGIDVLAVSDVPVRRLVFCAHRRGSASRPSIAVLIDSLQEATAARRAAVGGR